MNDFTINITIPGKFYAASYATDDPDVLDIDFIDGAYLAVRAPGLASFGLKGMSGDYLLVWVNSDYKLTAGSRYDGLIIEASVDQMARLMNIADPPKE